MDLWARSVACVGLLAGVLLCVTLLIAAIQCYRRDGDLLRLLVSLAAAAVALCAGIATLCVVFIELFLPMSFPGISASRVCLVYIVSVVSVPIGVGWAWALHVSRGLAAARGGKWWTVSFARSLGGYLFAIATSTLALQLESFVRYGRDFTIGVPGISAAIVFLGVMMLLAVRLIWDNDGDRIVAALRYVGFIFGDAVILTLGTYILALAAYTLSMGTTHIFETWNVLVFFYPIYFIASLALGGALLFLGVKIFVKAWPGLSSSLL